MKLIIAYIQSEKLDDVKQALCAKELARVAVADALRAGRLSGCREAYCGVDVETMLLQKTRLEIAAADCSVDRIIAAIVQIIQSGKAGDGRVFVLPLEECIHVQTTGQRRWQTDQPAQA